MADVQKAINFVLQQEDSRMSGIITTNAHDKGGRTRFGVAEAFHPELTKTGFFDTMPVSEALNKAILIYRSEYADPLQLAGITNQSIANAVLSFAVNEGLKTSVQLLQQALGIPITGILGPATKIKLNDTNPHELMFLLYGVHAQYYHKKVADDPSQQRFLSGWMSRVRKACTIVFDEVPSENA